jgi:chemotaxis protein histidine kinase CheA
MIEQRSDGLDPMVHERLLASVSQLTRNTRDLQEAVMSIRMMPMDFVFSRFPRMVRDLASKLGKKVDFITNGAATELDKGLIERIVDPLTHLVRNSIDHGIEMPAARVAAGKSESGRLFLSAAHQGGNIVIEVADDGGGLNRERILAKAQQNGLPVSDNMSDADVWQLIFAPGFSTAEIVTDVSGRGVGMDVVKRNITAMGGTIDIRSAKGFGTTILISLPLTLAILDGMSIRCGDEIYILPLGFVVESLQPARERRQGNRRPGPRGQGARRIPAADPAAPDVRHRTALYRPVRRHPGDPRDRRAQGRAVRRRTGGPAAGRGEEPRIELPQGGRDLRRHHPRRWRRGADPRRGGAAALVASADGRYRRFIKTETL